MFQLPPPGSQNMSNLSAVEAKLPPGFRFHPRDEELICDYLMKKVTCAIDLHPLMIQVDLNKCEPWDIPESALVGGKECYFYSQRDRKYATGLRTNRATASGYWKATGKDRSVLRNGTLVGMRKTLVFYRGRAPKGRKTDWVMHEFRLEGPFTPANLSTSKEDWVLCRVLVKNRDEVTKQLDTGSSSSGGGCGDTSPSSTSWTTAAAAAAPYMTCSSSDQISHPNNMNDTYNQLQVSAGSFSIFTVPQPPPPPNDHHHHHHDHDQINDQQNSNNIIIPTFSYLTHMENNNFLPNNNSFGIGGLGTDFGITYNNNNYEEKKGIKYHVLTSTESYPPHHHHHVINGGSSPSFGGDNGTSSDTFFIREGGGTF